MYFLNSFFECFIFRCLRVVSYLILYKWLYAVLHPCSLFSNPWSFLGFSVSLCRFIFSVIFFSLLGDFFSLLSYYYIPWHNPSSTSLSAVITLFFPFASHCLSPSLFPLSYFLLWLFLPVDLRSSLLIITSFLSIYRLTCPWIHSRPHPPNAHTSSYSLARQFTSSYLSSLSTAPHFNHDMSSLLQENGVTKHQLQSKLVGCLNRRPVVQWSGWPWMSVSKQDERQGQNCGDKA